MEQFQVPKAVRLWGEQQARYVRQRNQDLWIPFTGPTGSGKSNTMLVLAGLLDPTFWADPLEKRMAWKGDVFTEVLDRIGRYQLAILDEAGRAFWRRQAMKNENREAMLSVYEDRKFNRIKFIGFPDFEELDPRFTMLAANHRVACSLDYTATLYQAARNKAGKVVGWAEIVTFTPPNLSEIRPNVWAYYEKIAEEMTRRGTRSEGQDLSSPDENLPSPIHLARTYQSFAQPLAQRWTPTE